jgi:type I restriction enzyme, S subunit
VNSDYRSAFSGARLVPISHVVKELQGGRSILTDNANSKDTVYRVLKVSAVTWGEFRPCESKPVPAGYAPPPEHIVRAGDLLFSRANTTELVGAVVFVHSTPPNLLLSDKTWRFVWRDPSIVEPQYMRAVFQHPDIRTELGRLATGTSGSMKNISMPKLMALEVPLPSLREQQRIASILTEQLSSVERGRTAAKAQLDAADKLPQALLDAVFDGPEAQRWPKRALGDVGQIASGITLGWKAHGQKTRRVPYLRVANVKDGRLDLSTVYEIEATEFEIEKLRLEPGDILLTEGGDPDKLGRGTFWNDEVAECIHQNHIFRVRFDLTEFSPPFISAQIGSLYGKAYFLAHAKQTTGIATINQKVLRGFSLMSPPLAVQQQVVETLTTRMREAQNVRRAAMEQVVAINGLSGTFLRQAFSGAAGHGASQF